MDDERLDEDEQTFNEQLDDELLAAPWNTTRVFLSAIKGFDR